MGTYCCNQTIMGLRVPELEKEEALKPVKEPFDLKKF